MIVTSGVKNKRMLICLLISWDGFRLHLQARRPRAAELTVAHFFFHRLVSRFLSSDSGVMGDAFHLDPCRGSQCLAPVSVGAWQALHVPKSLCWEAGCLSRMPSPECQNAVWLALIGRLAQALRGSWHAKVKRLPLHPTAADPVG